MDNIWFYTLSTSAQVLASLAGLFAVFVVWKIQDFEKYINEVRYAILRIMPYLSNTVKDYEMKKIDELFFMTDLELLSIFSEVLEIKEKQPERITYEPAVITTENQISYSLDDKTRYLYKKNIDKKNDIIEILKNILIINFAVISVCVLALTFSSLIYEKFIILIIISIAVIFCLYVISRGIYRIILK